VTAISNPCAAGRLQRVIARACLAAVVVLRREFIGGWGAGLEGVVAVVPEHEISNAPDVDLGHHARNNGKICELRLREKSSPAPRS
jgi:hypothetical protein